MTKIQPWYLWPTIAPLRFFWRIVCLLFDQCKEQAYFLALPPPFSQLPALFPPPPLHIFSNVMTEHLVQTLMFLAACTCVGMQQWLSSQRGRRTLGGAREVSCDDQPNCWTVQLKPVAAPVPYRLRGFDYFDFFWNTPSIFTVMVSRKLCQVVFCVVYFSPPFLVATILFGSFFFFFFCVFHLSSIVSHDFRCEAKIIL